MSNRLNLEVHKYERDPQTNRPKLAEFNPYISVRNGDEGELFIQNGKVFTRNGPPVSDPPPWFWDEVKKMTPQALEQVKFRLPSPKADPGTEQNPEPVKRRRGRPRKRLTDG